MADLSIQSCIDACVRCAQACEHCADACLNEHEVKMMAECIRLDKDCAITCWTAAGMMSRHSRFVEAICRLCADICEACGIECGRHENDHCKRCADACMQCAEECLRMVGTTLPAAMVN